MPVFVAYEYTYLQAWVLLESGVLHILASVLNTYSSMSFAFPFLSGRLQEVSGTFQELSRTRTFRVSPIVLEFVLSQAYPVLNQVFSTFLDLCHLYPRRRVAHLWRSTYCTYDSKYTTQWKVPHRYRYPGVHPYLFHIGSRLWTNRLRSWYDMATVIQRSYTIFGKAQNSLLHFGTYGRSFLIKRRPAFLA
jgi:hypothetical protein